ncbi:23S rRNA (uracil(747)-C(5))-methyltransferase RlmC [Actinotalea sp. K2]|uniref:23S rRNA (uracil(747)-C(5))-methyltransferase RlmC n=1 Tax=Actinotalea sp. K2 TaxID=2939438 RepID=UPI002016F02B|nr:23S rRNA (uracil(747)-C(5))-methyltransferase RlmC [Actinotalea sp. K2]MCL3862477.1 23S rRNA (uracil(747)-C(5))-methyltransferase RlmC [Actinotalea sp. K2]
MRCPHFDAARCRSCTLMGTPHPVQVSDKQRHCQDLLGGDMSWLPPVTGPERAFRNKAKMVVGGTVREPTLGILDPRGHGVDLRDCGLYPESLQASLGVLAAFVVRAALTPYDLSSRTGELKHLLVTESPDGELMVRFVLRSQEPVARIRKHLPWLLQTLPGLVVASVNLLPEHRAVLEGEREIVLTERSTITLRVNGIDLHLRPQSFFQTNTEVAAALYRQARTWVEELAPPSVWDLYCGVGGFALHCAAPGREVLGVEVSAEAVASATLSAREAGLGGVRFTAGDATAHALAGGPAPALVIVNPPRRGIGAELAGWLERSSVEHVVYSSCNAESLARDLAAMPSLAPRRAQLLDMFPQTAHYEVLTLLERR